MSSLRSALYENRADRPGGLSPCHDSRVSPAARTGRLQGRLRLPRCGAGIHDWQGSSCRPGDIKIPLPEFAQFRTYSSGLEDRSSALVGLSPDGQLTGTIGPGAFGLALSKVSGAPWCATPTRPPTFSISLIPTG